MLKFTPDKTLEAIFEAKTNQECSMMWGHLVETFKLLMLMERFWEPGKLIAGTLGAQGKREPTAAMSLKPTSDACERFIYLLDELVSGAHVLLHGQLLTAEVWQMEGRIKSRLPGTFLKIHLLGERLPYLMQQESCKPCVNM